MLLKLKLIAPIFLFSLLGLNGEHKYYVSITKIVYKQEEQAVQILSRIFIDDLEDVLQERYNKSFRIDSNELEVDKLIDLYLSEKFRVEINGVDIELDFLGKTIENDIVKCFIEIENVTNIKTLKISNQVLFDLYPEQQNIIRTDINSKEKSFILTSNDKAMVLKFN